VALQNQQEDLVEELLGNLVEPLGNLVVELQGRTALEEEQFLEVPLLAWQVVLVISAVEVLEA
jgi:hypothetical protein